MAKLIAIVHVVVWSGFWAFGYIALSSGSEGGTQVVVATILAALGAGLGVLTWMWLVRHSEDIGYAARPRRAMPTSEDDTP